MAASNLVHHSYFELIIHLRFSIFANMNDPTERQNHSLPNGPSHNTSGDEPGLFAQHQAAPVQGPLSHTGHELVKAVHAFQWDGVIKTSANVRPDEWEYLFDFRFDDVWVKVDRNILHYIIVEQSKTKDVPDHLRLRAAEALMKRAPDDKTKSDIINKGDYQGKTALHLAAIGRTLPFLRFLLENGADVNCQDLEGNTPLHNASMFDNSEIAKTLVEEYAANPLLGNNGGQTPLHFAATSLSLDTIRSLRKCLDDREADSLPFDNKCMTPVDQARCIAWHVATNLDGKGATGSPKGIKTFQDVIASLLQDESPQEHTNVNSSHRQHELRICSEPTGIFCVLGKHLQPDGITTTTVCEAFPKPVAELLGGPRPLLEELRRRQFAHIFAVNPPPSPPWLSAWVHLPAKNVCKL